MAAPHAASGDLIDIRPLGADLSAANSVALVRSDHLEVFRMVLPAGRSIPEHWTQASTVQCIEGVVEAEVQGRTQLMTAGSLLFLSAGERHAFKAREDASLLVTMLSRRE